jgi:hypothetical protein
MSNYAAAELRVDGSDALKPYRAFFLGDWAEGESHYAWVASAEESDLLFWANYLSSQVE